MAKRTAVGLNEIRKLINVEHKFVDVNNVSATTQAGTVTYLSGMNQGDNISEREGDSIKIQSFDIIGQIQRDPASAAVDGVRLLIIRDLQNTGAAPLGTDVLETVGTIESAFQQLDFLNGNDLNKRFTVVYDELFSLDTYHPVRQFRFRTTHDCHVFYRGTTSAVGSAGNGSYFMIAYCNALVAQPNVVFSTRLRFTDN